MADPTASFPAELLETNSPERLTAAAIACTVVTTLVYVLFNISRYFCADRNGWEVWTLYPLSYVFILTLCILGYREYSPYLLLSSP